MSSNILNDQESFTRTKKKLKKLLEDKGLKLSLCETSDLLAKALGFKNTFDMQKNLNEKPKEEAKLNESNTESPWDNSPLRFFTKDGKEYCFSNSQKYTIEKETIDGIKNINIILPIPHNGYRPNFSEGLINEVANSLVNINGHVIITGRAGVGKTTLMRELKNRKNILSFGDINDVEYDPEEEVFSHKHLELINNSDRNILFCLHDGLINKGIKMVKLINSDFNINNIQYVINIKLIKESEQNGNNEKVGFGENYIKKLNDITESYHIMDNGDVIKEKGEPTVSSSYKIEDAPEIVLKKKK